MRETIEFRIPEGLARKYLPDVGALMTFIRRVEVDSGDPLLARLGAVDRELRLREGASLYTSWRIRRTYSTAEIQSAGLLRVLLTVVPVAGEEYGSTYDDSPACPVCRAGGQLTGELLLDERKLPKRSAFVKTMAGEILVSRDAAEVLLAHLDVHLGSVIDSRTQQPSGHWYCLRSVPGAVAVDPLTAVGPHPFSDGLDPCRCPKGDTLGLALLSELVVDARGNQSPLVATAQFFGRRQGLLRPERELLVTPRLWSALQHRKLRGVSVEVAHVKG